MTRTKIRVEWGDTRQTQVSIVDSAGNQKVNITTLNGYISTIIEEGVYTMTLSILGEDPTVQEISVPKSTEDQVIEEIAEQGLLTEAQKQVAIETALENSQGYVDIVKIEQPTFQNSQGVDFTKTMLTFKVLTDIEPLATKFKVYTQAGNSVENVVNDTEYTYQVATTGSNPTSNVTKIEVLAGNNKVIDEVDFQFSLTLPEPLQPISSVSPFGIKTLVDGFRFGELYDNQVIEIRTAMSGADAPTVGTVTEINSATRTIRGLNPSTYYDIYVNGMLFLISTLTAKQDDVIVEVVGKQLNADDIPTEVTLKVSSRVTHYLTINGGGFADSARTPITNHTVAFDMSNMVEIKFYDASVSSPMLRSITKTRLNQIIRGGSF